MTPRPRAARTRTTRRILLSRRGLGAATALVLGGALVACTDGDGDAGGGNGASAGPSIGLVDGGPATSVLPGDDPAETAVQATSVLFESANIVLLASPETVESFAALAGTAHIPLLLGTDQPVLDELSRLGVEILVVAPGTDVTALGENYEVLEVDPDADGAADDLPDVSTAEDAGGPITLLLDPDGEDDPTAQTVARANVEAAGGAVAELPGGEPRRDATTVEVAEEAAPESAETGVLALGASFGDTEQLT
ncbi:MAG: hypothetical protein Q4G40_12100, partial [Brachybacterium sp.]|nr:hypothetical protein [Brachybacterium sp.]